MILHSYIYAGVMIIPVGLIYTFIIVLILVFGVENLSFSLPRAMPRWQPRYHSSGCDLQSWSWCVQWLVADGNLLRRTSQQGHSFLTRALERAADNFTSDVPGEHQSWLEVWHYSICGTGISGKPEKLFCIQGIRS